MLNRVTKAMLHPVLSPFRPGNIVMFHIGRCGSTVLSSLLRQHRNMMWASEFYVSIFRDWERANDGKEIAGEMPGDAIELLKAHMKQALHRYYGFEIKPFHFRLIGYEMEDYISNLEDLGFSHFIILDRENRLRKMVSSIIAHEDRNRYHQSGVKKSKLKQVTINVNHIEIDYESKPLLSFLDDYDTQFSDLKGRIGNRKLLNLTYENDIQNNPLNGYHKVCEFIGLKPKDVEVKLSRTNPFPLKDMIKNFDEVEGILRKTDHEWMLYE